MSSQADGTPLHHAPDNVGYRLIELPAEVQTLLESENPPVLMLESSDTSALLKTPDKTYSLRQKNTSNSIIILTSNATPSDSKQQEQEQQKLTAISTLHETVELDAVREPPAAAGPLKHVGGKGKWHEKFGMNR